MKVHPELLGISLQLLPSSPRGPSRRPLPRATCSFRINTCKSASKQMTLTPFRMNTYEKQGGGGVPISVTPSRPCTPTRARTAPNWSSSTCPATATELLQGTGGGEIPPARSVHDAEEECRPSALEPREVLKPWRSDVVVHVVEIAVIGEVDHVEAEANLARVTMPEWKAEVPERLEIERKESREPLPVGQPNVILPLIYLGIGETGVQVHDRPENEFVRKMKRPPNNYTVRNVRRTNTVNIGPDYRLLEGNEDVAERVQIAA